MVDGAGIRIHIPDALYRQDLAMQGIELPQPDEYGVAMVFLPKETASRLACEQELERAVRDEGQVVLGWRDVPVDHDMPMSPTVRRSEEHTSELQSLMRISYAVFCLKKKQYKTTNKTQNTKHN